MPSIGCPRRRAGLVAIAAVALLQGAAAAAWRSALPESAAVLVQSGQSPAPDDAVSSADADALAEERADCDRERRRGEARAAIRRLDELLDEAPGDAEARAILAMCWFDLCEYDRAIEEGRRAVAAAKASVAAAAHATQARAARTLALTLSTVGRARDACAVLDDAAASLDPKVDARDAWILGTCWAAFGDRDRARTFLTQGARTRDEAPWDALLARGLCQRRLGEIEAASKSMVAADLLAKAGEGVEPDILAALGDLYFEADREVEAAKHRSAARLYREALAVHPVHEASLLGLYRLHRYNWMRQSRPASDILDQLLRERPKSIEGRVAACGGDLDDGQLKRARERLAELTKDAPGRRDVRTIAAALAWVDGDPDQCERELADLAREDAHDAAPERDVARHLLELYRFAEGLVFARRAVERDATDYEAWTQLGRALANTGDEKAGLEALDRAHDLAGLRQDAWRDNQRKVLRMMATEHVKRRAGELGFAWNPEVDEVFATYLVPFYTEAREELSKRYGFTPGPTEIEVFKRHGDFSVRSTGFEGFPAFGVCFGPVVTAVSPLSELRGTFSWARTSFHEFTHVIHLGLSHNRCPRWITEGLATWEEVNKNPTWTRNMRRELVDSLANGEIIPTRELNRAFRGPRILFGYYQGGLLCELLIARHGFPPMIRLLEAFDRGLDLDQALDSVFKTTPEELDVEFLAFVRRETADLRIEPRWSTSRIAHLRATMQREAPQDPAKRRAWAEDGCTLAWGLWQSGKKIDAQEALRRIQMVEPVPPRADFLRGEVALVGGDRETAVATWKSALARGGEDFRVRMVLGRLAAEAGEWDEAEAQFLAAKRCFPGFDERSFSAELSLVEVYTQTDRIDAAQREREAWLAYNAGDLKERVEVARWHLANERYKEAAKYLEEANEIDPCLRGLHRDWGLALRALGRHAEALREFQMVLAIAPALDSDDPEPLSDEVRARILGLEAACLADLGRTVEAHDAATKALELDPDCAPAREVIEKLD